MKEIRQIKNLAIDDLKRIASGYSSDSKYIVKHAETENFATFELQLVDLERPYVKKYDHYDDETSRRYAGVLDYGYSYGAFDRDLMIGFVISEPRLWNRSLWVWEFHVAESYRQKGIGKRLMASVIEKAREDGLRVVVCETQNTNTTAIKIYHQLGFRIEGIDISYYSNNDYPDGEIAVFMKLSL